MATDRVKLTKTAVEAVAPPAAGERRLWDKEVSGLCLRVYPATARRPSGRRVYALKYRVGTRQRWHTIGEHGAPWTDDGVELTADLARKEAKRIVGLARDGRDLSKERQERRAAATVSDLIDRYLEEGPKTKPAKRATSWNADRGNLRHHVGPLIGTKLVREVTRSDIAKMVRSIEERKTAKPEVKTKLRGRARVRGGAGIAERAKAAVSAMFSWGIEHGIGAENPCKAVKLAKRATVERFLTDKQATNLLQVLAEMQRDGEIKKAHADIIRLLLLTGARKTEIVGLRWSEVDRTRKRLVLPPERTKAGGKTGERRIQLGTAAVALLEEQSGQSEFVFPAVRGDGPTTGVQKAWEAVRKRVGLADFRLHDLRHSFASFAVADGASLFLIAKALGHANARTSERYAHLAEDPVAALAEAAGRRFGGSGG